MIGNNGWWFGNQHKIRIQLFKAPQMPTLK